jgi:hypothetical protein
MNHTRLWRIAHGSSRSALIVAAGVFFVVLALLYASAKLVQFRKDISTHESVVAGLNSEIRQLAARNDEQLERLRQAETQVATAKEDVAARDKEIADFRRVTLAGLGHKKSGAADSAALERSLAARDLADRIAQTGGERRAQVRLRYYPADFERHLNETVVLAKLGAYGFRIEKAGARIASVPVNAVWIGEDVHPDDARLVVLTLVSAGVDVKAVRHFREPRGPKKKLIEIGTDSSLARAPGLSTTQIMALAKFKRQQ